MDPLQKGSFPAILCQKAAAGVSLAAAFLLVLRRKSLFLKCFAVLLSGFFPAAISEDAAILDVLQGRGGCCGGKDGGKTESIPMANRLMGDGVFGTAEGMHPLRVCRPCGTAAADFAARTCHRHVLLSPLTLSGFESLRPVEDTKTPPPKVLLPIGTNCDPWG